MVQKAIERKEPVPASEHSFPGGLDITGRFTLGALGSRFLIELRDNQKFMGIRCAKCNKVYVPPRLTCFSCFSKLDEWVEVANKGTVEGYSKLIMMSRFIR